MVYFNILEAIKSVTENIFVYFSNAECEFARRAMGICQRMHNDFYGVDIDFSKRECEAECVFFRICT